MAQGQLEDLGHFPLLPRPDHHVHRVARLPHAQAHDVPVALALGMADAVEIPGGEVLAAHDLLQFAEGLRRNPGGGEFHLFQGGIGEARFIRIEVELLLQVREKVGPLLHIEGLLQVAPPEPAGLTFLIVRHAAPPDTL
jgi:hypothetical protein